MKPKRPNQKFLDNVMYENVKQKIQQALETDDQYIKTLLKNPTATPSQLVLHKEGSRLIEKSPTLFNNLHKNHKSYKQYHATNGMPIQGLAIADLKIEKTGRDEEVPKTQTTNSRLDLKRNSKSLLQLVQQRETRNQDDYQRVLIETKESASMKVESFSDTHFHNQNNLKIIEKHTKPLFYDELNEILLSPSSNNMNALQKEEALR